MPGLDSVVAHVHVGQTHHMITASWCSIVERLEHLMLSVCCFPSYCLLAPLMSPKDKKCELA